jgi:glyoxylase I family protein
MKLLSVHHIAIICSDYKKSKEFYVQKLGLKVLAETYRQERESYKLDLALGELYQIELFSFPHPPPRTGWPEACGLRHLAFAVENVEKAAKELNKLSIVTEMIRTDELTGKKFTFFKDPDGLPLELYEV